MAAGKQGRAALAVGSELCVLACVRSCPRSPGRRGTPDVHRWPLKCCRTHRARLGRLHACPRVRRAVLPQEAAPAAACLPSRARLVVDAGMRGASSVREVHLATGKVLRKAVTDKQDFGEGLSSVGDK